MAAHTVESVLTFIFLLTNLQNYQLTFHVRVAAHSVKSVLKFHECVAAHTVESVLFPAYYTLLQTSCTWKPPQKWLLLHIASPSKITTIWYRLSLKKNTTIWYRLSLKNYHYLISPLPQKLPIFDIASSSKITTIWYRLFPRNYHYLISPLPQKLPQFDIASSSKITTILYCLFLKDYHYLISPLPKKLSLSARPYPTTSQLYTLKN